MTFDSVVQSDSSPPINECCQIKSKFLHRLRCWRRSDTYSKGAFAKLYER